MKTKSEIEKIIESSEDIVTALETIAPDYSIPTTNILRDDSLNKIKVKNDMIIAPAKSTKGNTNAIICSIGAVLDYISQRIDSKLNAYQKSNYDKTFDINDKESIPTNDESGRKSFFTEKPSYYTDVDDITRGVDMNMSNPSVSDNPILTDVPHEINESEVLVDMYDKYGTNMGYSIFQELGFTSIKPVESFVTEAEKSPEISSFETMKFDNKNLLKAVKCFNDARNEQVETTAKTFDYERFVSSKKFADGVDALAKQFDARLVVRHIKSGDNVSESDLGNAFTYQWETYNKITISKSKGFQLNRMPIDVFLLDNMLLKMFPKDQQYFGQTICGIFLHEIFHNIYFRLFTKETEFRTAVDAMFTAIDGMTDTKDKKDYVNKFIDYLVKIEVLDKKALNPLTKRSLNAKLRLIASARSKKALKYLKDNESSISGGELSEKEIDKMIEYMDKAAFDVDKVLKQTRILTCVSLIVSIGTGVGASILSKEGGILFGLLGTVSIGTALSSLGWLGSISAIKEYKVLTKKYDSVRNFEEYWCDLFAGMYNVPVAWTLGLGYNNKNKSAYACKFRDDQIQKYAELDVKINKIYLSSYPSGSERLYASTKIAKTALESNADLAPEFKGYLQWIVDNNERILSSGLDKNYNRSTFDPSETDMKKHLENVVNKADKTNPEITK